jgi:hypothetical protein
VDALHFVLDPSASEVSHDFIIVNIQERGLTIDGYSKSLTRVELGRLYSLRQFMHLNEVVATVANA